MPLSSSHQNAFIFCNRVALVVRWFFASIRQARHLLEIPSVDASLSSVVMLPSKDATSTFAAFPLQVPSSFFRNVCSAVDAACAALSLPSQSLSPMPHLSFARIPTSLRDAPAVKLPRGSKIPLRSVNVTIGKQKHILPLSGV